MKFWPPNNNTTQMGRLKHMEYTPKEFKSLGIGEVSPNDMNNLTDAAVVRRLRVIRFTIQDEMLSLHIETPPIILTIPCERVMQFGPDSITAKQYFVQVIENRDLIDAVITPRSGDVFPMRCYWIHIEYVGQPSAAGRFAIKEDGLFAMRAKAGEKAERIVARLLRDAYGHPFPTEMCESPGFFEIRYAGKKQRKPDRRCKVCGLTFEMKKRNKDQKFRISHSDGRPFASENALDGWHAFVFPDMKPRFVKNSVIIEAINNGRFKKRDHSQQNENEVDEWADVDPDAIVLSSPPNCLDSGINAGQ
jgi:hypothetical protein